MSIYRKDIDWGGIDLDCNLNILTNILRNLNNIKNNKFIEWKLWTNISSIRCFRNLANYKITPHLTAKVFFDNKEYLDSLNIELNSKNYYKLSREMEKEIISSYFKKKINYKKIKLYNYDYYIFNNKFYDIYGFCDVIDNEKIIEIKYIRGENESKNQLMLERALLQLSFYDEWGKSMYLGLIDQNKHLYLFKINELLLSNIKDEFIKRLSKIYKAINICEKNNFSKFKTIIKNEVAWKKFSIQ